MSALKDSIKSVSRRRWVASFILVGVGIATTFLIITYFFPGDTFLDRLEVSYRFLWEHTTRRQFTDIMRERPWLFITPGVIVLFITGLLLPLKFWSRALLVYIAFGIGIVAGHLFW